MGYEQNKFLAPIRGEKAPIHPALSSEMALFFSASCNRDWKSLTLTSPRNATGRAS
jgi:hypothetical protein